jgi:hypothetical protein
VSHDITFQMEVIILLGYAQIAAALSGFIGVAFVFGERSQRRLSVHDSSAVFHFMFAGLGALFLCLLTAVVLVCSADNENIVWRLGNSIGGLMHLVGATRLALETKRDQTAMRSAWAAASLGWSAGIVSWMSAAGYLISNGNLIFFVSTLWTLGVTVISFISLITAPRTAS